jgi:predicted component of type VI protein secretion system
MNKYTADKISRTIRQMVEKWEPRIRLIDIPIKAVEDEATYYIQLQYEVPDLLKQRNL